jgi:hypothetical protein
MPSALSWTPDPLRHIVRLPNLTVINAVMCIKVYATNYAVVYLPYGWESVFSVYAVSVANNNHEVRGDLIATTADLVNAVDLAGQESPA